MALTYREKMNITEKFLGEMRHRLSDKDTSVLPRRGSTTSSQTLTSGASWAI